MFHYAWVIAFTGTLVLILSHGFGRMSYSLILGSMKEGLSLSYTQIGLIGTGNFIGYLCLAVIGGFLASRFGTRRVIFISLLIMGISLFLTGLSNSFVFAFLMRLITGMGNAGSYVPMMALPAAWFVANKRGLATGIITLGTGTGLSITGLIIPRLISMYGVEGWRYAWHLLGIIVFVFSFLCYFLLRDNPAEKGLTMYGGVERQNPKDKDFTFFSAWKNIMQEKEIWRLGLVYFMYGFSYIIYLTFIIAFLTKEVGIADYSAGRVFAVLGFFAIFCGVIWGGLSDIIGRRYATMCAYLVLAISSILLIIFNSTVLFYISAIMFGLTAFSVPVIMAAAAGDAMGARLAPAALGFITLFFGIGQALGPFVSGWLKDVSGTFKYAFALSAFISIIGAVTSLTMKKKQKG
ncbi:MAG TPA: MFS transporter [Syntrophorhabdaceae bacterium]|nr:MFS transporter [Syntrophorhabdaceae bacterium]HOL06432.1 MFS transporter [Syntrophorhabdaceae bacterium]HON85436.1 MFS transporter [Syntrophorhabdaceae bacterium]HOT41443.1 MFS transporter [Syntrophorhabdaceae bacterium]HPC66868.1 MFS transporter [Syntrophorhabdaceae bacterium]